VPIVSFAVHKNDAARRLHAFYLLPVGFSPFCFDKIADSTKMIFEGPGMKNTNVSVVKAKREFSELLGRVAVGKETFTITRRGKPMAVLAPTGPAEGLQGLKGWLENDDPFFRDIQHIIGERKKQKARRVRLPKP
jgi:prevent-host-death family protein